MSGPGAVPAGPAPRTPTAQPTAHPTAPLLNVANAVTLLRLCLVPVFGAFLLAGDGRTTFWRVAAGVVFAVASLTDRVDGALARRRNLVTAFGTVADPIADKALMGTALVALSALGELPWLVTLVVLAREVGVTVLRFWVIRHGVMAASRGGKLKTLLQGVALGLYILPLTGWLGTARAVVMTAAVVLTVVTGADYLLRALRLRTTSPRAQAKRERRAMARSTGRP